MVFNGYTVGAFLCIIIGITSLLFASKILSKYYRYAKIASYFFIGVILLVSFPIILWRGFTTAEGRELYEAQQMEENLNIETPQEKKGLDYIRTNLKNEDISISRYQYLNEEVCAEEDSPFKQFEGLSVGFYDYSGESLGNGQIWVFFKHGEPRFMTIRKNWKSELSDSELILLLIDAWENKSQSDRDLDRIKNNAYREMQFDPSYQRMMRNARGY